MNSENQVFGLENFGNTCYCNSVVQALYHTKPFKDYILSLSPVDRPKRLRTPGSAAHPAVNTTSSSSKPEPTSPSGKADILSSSQRSGFSAFKSRFSKSGSHSSHGDSTIGSPASPHSLNTHLSNTHISSSPDQNSSLPVPIVGFLEDGDVPTSPSTPSSSSAAAIANNNAAITDSLIDQRKRNAMLKGPIVNVDESFSEQYNRKESLVTALKDLFESIDENESSTGVASPSRLVKVLKSENSLFRSSMHQDAQEFLNFLLNRVIEEDTLIDDAVDSKNDSHVPKHPKRVPARSLFAGELSNELRCLYCETITRRNEPFFDFSLETLPDSSVYNSLQQFSKSEVMSGNDKYFCDVCGAHQEAVKRMKVNKAPPILILHLKRFKFSEDEQRNTKLLHRVLYSKYLRLPVTTDECPTPEKLYELTSVIVHLGGGPSMGHYVVVTKTSHGWLLFDDEIVDKVDESYVYRFFGDRSSLSTAYLLIYQEVDERQHEHDNLDDQVSPEFEVNEIAKVEDAKKKHRFSLRRSS